jgi:hypothetical protein
MTERTFRIFLGASLFILLYVSALMDRADLILYYIALLFIEGITNQRLPKLISSRKYKIDYNDSKPFSQSQKERVVDNRDFKKNNNYLIPFEAERAMRIVVAFLLAIPFMLSNGFVWIIPWFVASMLLLAGVTNICPMVMFFRWLGFK